MPLLHAVNQIVQYYAGVVLAPFIPATGVPTHNQHRPRLHVSNTNSTAVQLRCIDQLRTTVALRVPFQPVGFSSRTRHSRGLCHDDLAWCLSGISESRKFAWSHGDRLSL